MGERQMTSSEHLRRPPGHGRRRVTLISAALAVAAVAAACSSGEQEAKPGADCIQVDAAVSSEKIQLLTDLAEEFNATGEEVKGSCIWVEVQKKASGAAEQALAEGWDTATDGPEPTIWSPASAAWGQVLNQRLAEAGDAPMAPEDPTPFMLTPLVIAMPEPMAEALGWPDQPIGWADILALARTPEGWAAKGHPEWGPFRLGKTNPNFSTSGLSALIAQNYAATGKTTGLTTEDLERPEVQQYGEDIESAVVHYGDITMTFLDNWYRADRRGTGLTYASAVAVEEKSVIDYNAGNPDGVLDPGEEARPPRIPLVAIYPTEGTLYSDNPLFVLDAPWVTPKEAAAAERFQEFVSTPENQRKVLEYGFRPGNPEVAIDEPVSTDNGVDPTKPETLLDVPAGEVLTGLLDNWAEQRKSARVLMVLDVSGSMGEPADPSDPGGPTRLDLAVRAVQDGLDEFKPEDQVGLRIFTTNLGDGTASWQDLSPVSPIGPKREELRSQVANLAPLNGTPLYDVVGESHDEMIEGYDPTLINAVVLLTDGMNDDGEPDDDEAQFRELLDQVTRSANGENSTPVRIFTIAYGAGADPSELRQIAQASNATPYQATDATTIESVFTAVVSNF
jgi:Ca-activated chloride channel family protein